MDEIYITRKTDDKEIKLFWTKPKDACYKRFVADLQSLLEKYEYCFVETVGEYEEVVEDKTEPVSCDSYNSEDLY